MAGLTTLEEMERAWTLIDLADAHEALDVKYEAEMFEINKNKKAK